MLVRGPMAVRYEVTSLFYDKTDTGLRSFLRKLSVRLDSDQEKNNPNARTYLKITLLYNNLRFDLIICMVKNGYILNQNRRTNFE